MVSIYLNLLGSLNVTDGGEDDDFDSTQHSKAIFKELNSFKTSLSKLEDKINSISIPSESGVTEENVKEVKEAIALLKQGKYRGKSMLWNEKGYNVLSAHFLRRVKGEKVGYDIKEIYETNNVGKTVEHSVMVRGKYDADVTALMLVLKNSINIKAFLSDLTPYCAVSYVEGKKGKLVRALTTVAFSK